MSKASQAMQDLAQRLFAIEEQHASQQFDSFGRVRGKLQTSLTKFAGPVGYQSLLSRAVALAKVELPELVRVTVESDGSLNGFHELQKNSRTPSSAGPESFGIAIVAHLLGLLVIFIGESLMVSLLNDAWPSESFDSVDQKIEDKS